MKIAASALLGFLVGAIGVYLVTRVESPLVLAISGSGSEGVSIRGIFSSGEACTMFREIYLKRRKSIAESIAKDATVELNENAGIVATSDGRWYTASCVRSTQIPRSIPDFSGIEDALRDIASNVIR